jgi:nucleotide-binding universal stress UspA family protein
MSAPSAAHPQRIVVGVDGSPSAKEALRWAIGQARLTGGTVDAGWKPSWTRTCRPPC